MNDLPTSIQYGLGVAIGHLVIQARKDGASDDELIATLRNTIRILEDHKAVLRAQRDRNPALTDAVVTTFIRAVWAARDKAIADDHDHREHRVARQRRHTILAQHDGRDQRNLYDRHRQRQQQRAVGLTDPFGDDLRMVDRGEHGRDEHRPAADEQPGLLAQGGGEGEHRRGCERCERRPVVHAASCGKDFCDGREHWGQDITSRSNLGETSLVKGVAGNVTALALCRR